MKKRLEWLLIIILVALPVVAYLSYFLPPNYSRLSILLVFFMPFIFALYSQKSSRGVLIILLSFIVISTLVFITRNVAMFNVFMGGVGGSGTRLLAQRYRDAGNLVFPDSHSYFPQTSLLLYALSTFCGFSLFHSSIVIISLHIFLTALIGLYTFKTMTKNQRREKEFFLPLLAVFSLFVSHNLMYTNVAYRYLASPLFLLLLLHIYDGNYGEAPQRRYYVVTLLLSVGILLGDPISALIMIPLFMLVSVLGRRRLEVIYALIPFSYLVYSAKSYVLSLRSYTRFALKGFLEFLGDLTRQQFPERVIPWRRTLSLSVEDAYLTSIGYISLLVVSAIIGMTIVIHWIRGEIREDTTERSVLAKATGLALLSMSSLGAFTYIGTSVMPEVRFSDIRTIALIFSSLLLIFSFTTRTLKKRLEGSRTLFYIISFLLIFSSLRIIYSAYPKSIYDPPNVVEDVRLSSTSVYVVANFLQEYYKSGGVIVDYKTLNRIGRTLPAPQYEKRWLNETTIDYPFTFHPTRSILVFNTAGNTYPSVFHPPEAYQAANDFSLEHNRIYDNGFVVAASSEGN